MKSKTEVEQLTQHLRDEDYHAAIRGLIERVCGVEVCEHDHIRPCRYCLLDVDNPILERWEDL